MQYKTVQCFLLNDLVVDGWCHSDGASGEVGVEVLSVHQLDTGWRVAVRRQQVVNVVLAIVPGQSDEA